MRHSSAETTMDAFDAGRESPAGAWIELGALRLPRDSIVGCRIEDVVERDTAGRLASLGLLFAAVLVLSLGLIDLSWGSRLMVGVVVLGVIGAVSAMETLGLNKTLHYRLDILLNDGRRVGYTTESRRDAEALADDLR